MDLALARARYLAALGLLGGCHSPTPVTTSGDAPTATGVASTTASASPSAMGSTAAPPTASAAPSAAPTASAEPTATASAASSAAPTTPATPEALARAARASRSDAKYRRAPLPGGAWTVSFASPPIPTSHGRYPVYPCPSGEFCLPDGSTKSGPTAEPPYAACAETASEPADPVIDGSPRMPHHQGHFDSELTARERASDPSRATACCYQWMMPCPGGRTLRDGDGAVVARLRETPEGDAAWVDAPRATVALDRELARAWAEEAAYEHASVASFNLAVVDWMGLGAPSELVEAGQRAALDEIAHARALYGLASSYAGSAVGPDRLPARRQPLAPTFDRVTRETFLDACVNECIAAATAEARAAAAEEPTAKAALATIARDEAAHAELAFRVLGWLLAAGGGEARTALEASLAALEAMPDPLPCPDAPASGFLSPGAQLAVRRRVLDEVVRPVTVALLAGAPASA